MADLTSQEVKDFAMGLGADLVGLASAQELNENPPDMRWPQTPSRLWPECGSLIVLAKAMPMGVYRSHARVARLGVPHLVLASLDRLALELTYFLEGKGSYAIPFHQQATDTELKMGTYGSLSLRHVAVEAGLGTLGLNLMLLTEEYGPRVYLTCVLTSAVLEPDRITPERLCLGPACGRCLLACPPGAVRHWGLDKRRCSTCAQVNGYPQLMSRLGKLLEAGSQDERLFLLRSVENVDYYQGLTHKLGAYAGCLRCVEVCPVGKGYRRHLGQVHKAIPEETPEKRASLEAMLAEEMGASDTRGEIHSRRWLGSRGTQ